MERPEIIEKVKEVCDYTFCRIPQDIENTTFHDFELDALDTVEFSMNLEDKFGITFSIPEWEKINSFRDVINFIESVKK